ncbi:hypothetical protein E2C01_058030 [Portunus trituberculatus]|uniref:Uncharacterized protein n=1 Tax=Portunus trituberculatus TaxID=210409 RepID=A0A5B7GYJ7_PORTR|nr:hypothetical protein [Portunus trituberculatus]
MDCDSSSDDLPPPSHPSPLLFYVIHDQPSLTRRMGIIKSFKQGEERKPQRPSPTSTWATPHSVLTCTAYIGLLIPSALN